MRRVLWFSTAYAACFMIFNHLYDLFYDFQPPMRPVLWFSTAYAACFMIFNRLYGLFCL